MIRSRSIRKIAFALSLSAVTVGGVRALETTAPAKVEYTFGSLRTTPAEAAKVKALAWLKAAGTTDTLAFDKVWAAPETSVLDKVLATFEIASPDARTILAQGRDAAKAAPKSVPTLFADKKLDGFFRANLALGYAKSLTNGRVYEDSLAALTNTSAEEVVDPSAYLFHRAVAEHALIKKAEAIKTIERLIDDVTDAPDRYRMLATIMYVDLQGWKKDDKDLGNIAKLMDNSERRLDLARADKVTQEIQKKIIFRLDEKIKEMESQCKGGGGGGSCPSGGPGTTQPGPSTNQPSNPADKSVIMNNGGPGKVDEKKIRTLAEKWGTLPEHERARALQEVTRDLPPKFKVVIEDYFKSMSRGGN